MTSAADRMIVNGTSTRITEPAIVMASVAPLNLGRRDPPSSLPCARNFRYVRPGKTNDVAAMAIPPVKSSTCCGKEIAQISDVCSTKCIRGSAIQFPEFDLTTWYSSRKADDELKI
jgi:hypothetical protein